ncbi:MAG: transporter [Frankiales bacterium]|nr:transporter [Frankiales bacterium]
MTGATVTERPGLSPAPLALTGTRATALLPVLIFLGMVVAVVSSLGAPLIPTIAALDRVSLSSAQWSLTITLLVGAVATPTMGRLGDGPHRKAVVVTSLAAVVTGSVLAALPLHFAALVVGRGLQGIGLGLTPLAIATARDHLPAEKSRSAIAMLSITTVAGVGLGYPLTGLIAEHFGFHGGFWFAAIISGVALLAAVLIVPASSHRPARPLDVSGALLLGAGLGLLLLGLSDGAAWGWRSARLIAAVAVAVVLLALFVVRELRARHPLVDLRLVRNRTVLTADVTGLCAGVGMYLLLSLITRFVQTPSSTGYGFGASIVLAGFVLLPFSVTSVASSKVMPLLARRTSPDLVLPLGCAVLVASMVSFLIAHSQLWQVFLTMALAGLGVGCTFAAMPGLIVRAVPPHETGSAMSFNQVLRTVGYSMGSAISATVLQAHTPAGARLPTIGGYETAAMLGLTACAATMVISFVLPRAGRALPSGVDEELLVQESVDAAASGTFLYDDGDSARTGAKG